MNEWDLRYSNAMNMIVMAIRFQYWKWTDKQHNIRS